MKMIDLPFGPVNGGPVFYTLPEPLEMVDDYATPGDDPHRQVTIVPAGVTVELRHTQYFGRVIAPGFGTGRV